MSEKRKFEEYHDPDYPQNNSSKRIRTTSLQSSEERNARIKEIINREFNREIQFREEQLDEIDTKIAKAKDILHQIRYTVVSDYYNKQSLQYSEAEAAALRGASLFDNEPDGPQIPLPPAVKKIVGKKPKTYDELLRFRPTVREAAKTAKTSIKEKSRTKKEEKRIQRMIKQRGIVIDHSNPEQSLDMAAMLGIRDPNGPIKIPRHIEPIKVEKPLPRLNSARLNNQTKHLIVVGNTSKYIGDEKPSDNSSHKWLVYVQAKSATPIEKFVTKVRFFLHPSYRPNDVVDVDSPPFQLARRGWGEFPVRLQLFFDPQIEQKPVQLVHNLVLDKTLSGLQTMGAETLVEIWLRTESIVPPLSPPTPSTSSKSSYRTETITKSKHLLSPSKTAEIINPKAEIDDNLFDFLDKIETPAICDDIDKIQPTFMNSPIIDNQICRRPLGFPPARNITESIMQLTEEQPSTSFTPSATISSSILKSPKVEEEITAHKIPPVIVKENNKIHQPIKTEPTTVVHVPLKSMSMESKTTPTITNTNGTNPVISNQNILQKKLVQFIDKEGNVKVMQMLIASKGSAPPTQPTIQKPTNFNGQLKVVTKNGDALQPVQIVRKLPPKVNEIDGNGNMRGGTSQQLKDASSSPGHSSPRQPSSTITQPESFCQKQFGPKPIFRRNGPAKNQVIHKEGKVFIIDPMQTKLKQEQKKQVSLLKPQISLLKPIAQNDNLGNCIRNNASNVFKHTSIATDHDYTNRLNPNRAPANTVTITKPSPQISPAFRRPNTITVRNIPNPANFIPSRVPELKKGNFFPVKVNHKPVIALMKKQRREYRRELEQQFNSTAFATVRSGVEFLLRRLPMVNNLALENDYRMAFPFVIATWVEFRKTIPIKLKALEWLRAKYISRSISQHPKLKTADLWTTKEIVIFARHHAYTPVINSMEVHNQQAKDGNKTVKSDNKDASLTELVKNEIEKEKITYQTVTPNHRICDWTERAWKRVNSHYKEHDTIIDVDGFNEIDNDLDLRRQVKHSPMKTYQGKLWLSIDEKLEKEANLVSGMCQDIGIRLQPEEIHRDVIHPTAQTLMSKTLRMFIQDIVRRSIGFKMKNNKEGTSSTELSLEPNDIRSALNSRPEFDFTTNKYFGTIKSKDLLEMG